MLAAIGHRFIAFYTRNGRLFLMLFMIYNLYIYYIGFIHYLQNVIGKPDWPHPQGLVVYACVQ